MEEKARVQQHIEQTRQEIVSLGDRLFAVPELGYTERETARVLAARLKELGIGFEDGLSLTGLRATLGQAGYHIALVADMDAISVTKEGQTVPYHSCGHHIQMAVVLGVLQALHESGAVDRLGGRVSAFFTPAEEYIDLEYRDGLIRAGEIRFASGKQDMIAAGLFDDVDCVLNLHVMGDNSYKFDVGSTLAGFTTKKVTFRGLPAHSGAAPHDGRNALHAASLSLQALSFVLEQFPASAGVRIYPILTQGGVAMNIIPEFAVLESYVRANTREDLDEARRRFDEAVRHCAAAIGVRCEVEERPGYLPLRQAEGLCEIVRQNMLDLCGEEDILEGAASGASGDVGDLSCLLPTVQLGFSGIAGRIHSDRFEVSDEDTAYINPAKVLAGAVVDLLEHPRLQTANPNFAADKRRYLAEWLGQQPRDE